MTAHNLGQFIRNIGSTIFKSVSAMMIHWKGKSNTWFDFSAQFFFCLRAKEKQKTRMKRLSVLKAVQKVVWLKVQRAELTCHVIVKRSICVKNIWIFARFLKVLRSCWEKSRKNWGDTEKRKEKLEANCTVFSAEFFGSQFLPGKQKFKCWQLLAGASFLSGSLFLNNYNFKVT